MGFETLVHSPALAASALPLWQALERGVVELREERENIPRIDDVATFLDRKSGESVTSVQVTLGRSVAQEMKREVLRRMAKTDGDSPEPTELGEVARELIPGLGLSRRLRNLSQDFKVRVFNRGDRPVMALMGDLLTGGYADRAVARDVVIPPNATGCIEVFCIEGGRNTGESTQLFDACAMAPPSMRVRMLASTQLLLWREIVEQLRALGFQTPEVSYCELAGFSPLQDLMSLYSDMIPDELPEGAAGIALRVGDRIEVADLFTDEADFVRVSHRFVESYRLEVALRALAADEGPFSIEPLFHSDQVGHLKAVTDSSGLHSLYFRP